MREKFICEICGKEYNKLNVCKICKRDVCDNEFDINKGICEVCKMTLCELCHKYLAVGICFKCGRLVCELCSKKINVAFICNKCISEH